MSLFGWGRSKRQTAELVDTILKSEIERRRIDSEMEAKRRELDIRARELELANLESIHDAARKDREAEQKLREDRRIALAKFKQENPDYWRTGPRRKREAARQQELAPACRVCINPGESSLSAIEIERHHRDGHNSLRLAGEDLN